MSSLFECITESLVRELGDKDLRPVRYLLSTNKFRLLSVLQKRKSCSRFWESPDVPAEYTLMDLLEPGASVPETAITGPFHFSNAVVQQQKASADVTAGLEMNVSGEATECHGSSLQFQVVTILPHNWKDLQKRKVLDPELLFLVKCRDRGHNLYVVTETVELTHSTVLHDIGSVTARGNCLIPWTPLVKGQGQGEGHRVRQKMLTLPQGTVMAYKRKQLVFKENGWDILITDDDKEKTFPRDAWVDSPREKVLNFLPSSPLLGGVWRVLPKDFEHLHEEIFQEVEALAQLSKDAQDAIFHNILNMLGNREALQDLVDELDGNPWDSLDGFGGKILNEMQEDIRDVWIQERFHMIYLLEAIMVLSNAQHDLLTQSMKKRTLLQQRELVKSILEPNFKCSGNIPFTLKPELLAPLQDEDLAITYGLLQECGLNMELNSPRSTWDLEAKQPLSALYGTLSVLQQLAVSPESPGPAPIYAGSVPGELRGPKVAWNQGTDLG
ncbi:gasdermin-C [Ursus americanus]|uniref:gasdermin-C n=1 Tax=Ursus americanus TaxID=9643 RepID=UPI001E67A96F|nr:gasdermin-C [Ursus americanus]